MKATSGFLAALSLLFLAPAGTTFAQPTWTRSFLTNSLLQAHRSFELPGGGFLVAGQDGDHPWVARLGTGGELLWQKRHTGQASLADAIATREGGAALLGTAYLPGDTVLCILKLDPTGALQWQKTYGGTPFEAARAIRELSSGGYVLSGLRNGTDLRVLRLDSSGNVLWQETLDIGEVEDPASIEETLDGGILVLALAGTKPWLAKLDLQGKILWERTYDIDTTAVDVEERRDGSLVLTAVRVSDTVVVRLDSLGEVQGANAYSGSPLSPRILSVEETADGGLVLGGWADTYACILRLDPAGDATWYRTYRGPGTSAFDTVAPTSDGGLLTAGKTDAYGLPRMHEWVMKLDAGGATTETCIYHRQNTVTKGGSWSPVSSITAATVTPTGATATDLAGTLENARAPVGQGCTCDEDTYEWDDAPVPGLTLIAEGPAQARNLCGVPEDWAPFEACAGRLYTVVTSNLGPRADTVLEMYRHDGTTLLASDDNGGGGLASRIAWSAPEDGTYFVRVRQADGTAGASREYELALEGRGCPRATWARTYGGLERDLPRAMAPIPGGGFLLAGLAEPSLYGFRALEVDGNGDVLWMRSYRAVLNSYSEFALSPAPGGRWLLLGSYGTPQRGVILMIGPEGEPLWSRTGDGLYTSAAVGPDGNAIVAVRSSLGETILLTLDPGGQLVAGDKYESPALSLYPTALRSIPGGGFLLVGLASSTPDEDVFVARLAPDRSWQWLRRYGGWRDETVYDARPTRDGGAVLAGGSDTFSSGNGDFDGWIVRADASGNVLWSRSLGTPAKDERLRSAVETPDGGFATAGTAGADLWLVRWDAGGTALWQRTLSGIAYWDRITIENSPDGGIVVLADMDTWSPRGFDFLLLKLDSSGRIEGNCIPGADPSIPVTSPSVNAMTHSWSRTSPLYSLSDWNLSPMEPPWQMGTPCTWTPSSGQVSPPGEVSPPGCIDPLRFAGPVTLTWEDANWSGSDRFNLYRGDIATLRSSRNYGSCLKQDLLTPTATDPPIPPGGACWFYIVTGENSAGEGPMGNDSSGTPRVNASPCP